MVMAAMPYDSSSWHTLPVPAQFAPATFRAFAGMQCRFYRIGIAAA
jgi:hypothetical protein